MHSSYLFLSAIKYFRKNAWKLFPPDIAFMSLFPLLLSSPSSFFSFTSTSIYSSFFLLFIIFLFSFPSFIISSFLLRQVLHYYWRTSAEVLGSFGRSDCRHGIHQFTYQVSSPGLVHPSPCLPGRLPRRHFLLCNENSSAHCELPHEVKPLRREDVNHPSVF